MATENKPTQDEINFAISRGSKSKLPNGDTRHVGRHPRSEDHKITVVTIGDTRTVRSANRQYLPMSEVKAQANKKVAEKKATNDRSKAAQKAQLEKKRARTPKPKNKPDKGPKKP